MTEGSILLESSMGYSEHSLNAVLAAQGRMILFGDINSKAAEEIIMLLSFLAQQNKDVTIYINSRGGEIEAGLAIYDAILAYPHELDIVCVEIAASMAALLLACGKKGHRFILPNSKVLIHEPLISNGFGGSATNIEKTALRILDVKEKMNTLLAKHTGKSLDEVSEAASYDHLMTAREAIDFGICDKIGSVYQGG